MVTVLSGFPSVRVVDSLLGVDFHKQGFRVHRLRFTVLRLECVVQGVGWRTYQVC